MFAKPKLMLIGAMALGACTGVQSADNRNEDASVAVNDASAPPADPVATNAGATADTPDPATLPIDFADLAGTWRIAAVAVPSSGIQALVTDDPTYMNREISIGGDRLAWRPARAGGSATGASEDLCGGPVGRRIDAPSAIDEERSRGLGVRAANAYVVDCDSGNWGPEAAGGARIYPIDRDTLAMSWYDNAMFKLTRVR